MWPAGWEPLAMARKMKKKHLPPIFNFICYKNVEVGISPVLKQYMEKYRKLKYKIDFEYLKSFDRFVINKKNCQFGPKHFYKKKSGKSATVNCTSVKLFQLRLLIWQFLDYIGLYWNNYLWFWIRFCRWHDDQISIWKKNYLMNWTTDFMVNNIGYLHFQYFP